MFRLVRTWGPWFLEIASLCAYVSGANCALAQITPDTTLPNNSRVNSVGNTSIIEGGTQAGGNLFHSFQQFSVPTGSTAHFKNAGDIQNIISRVTGGSVSNIDGLIRASGGANLFLINPNGIVFGQNARLNIGGSFLATTATSLKFADGFQFNATPSQAPLLTVTAPVGLGISSEPREIKVTGAGHDIDYNILQAPGLSDVSKAPRPRVDSSVMGLEVEPGKTLALVGGEVSVVGGVLRAPAGRIEIASVGSNGQVSLVGTQQGWKLDYQSNPKFGNINLSGKAFVNATGVGGGSIAIAGKDITLSEQSFLLADTLGDRNGAKISIVGDSILLNQSIISSNTFSSGNAGQIQLVANNLIRLENRSDADNNTQGLGQGGEITLNADFIVFRDRSGPSSNAYAQGKAGRIQVQANSLLTEQTSGFNTSSSGRGDAGEINIAVGDFVVRNQSGAASKTVGAGNGGKINITAKSLRIEDNSGFTTDTRNTGNAGEININVVGSVELRKDAGISTGSETNGDAGNISLTANSLLIEDHSGLNSSTTNAGKGGEINLNIAGSMVLRNSSGINSNSYGTGDAGNIRLTANSLLIEDHSAPSSSTTNAGKAGEINVNVAGSLVLQDYAGIGSNSSSTGDAGKITVTAESLKISDASEITTFGNGGNLTLDVGHLLLLRRNSQISATAGTANQGGNGGNITINAPSGFIVASPRENSDITANAFSGQGGKITINAAGIFGLAPLSRQDIERLRPNDLDPGQLQTNDITAISQQNPSLSGPVLINTPDVHPSRGLVQLPTNVVDASQQIDTSCHPGSRQRASSFKVTGRGGLPSSPDDMLTPKAVVVDWVTLNPSSDDRNSPSVTKKPTKPTPEPIVEATGWTRNAKGEIFLIANAPTVTPHSPQLTPASCHTY